MELVEKLEGFKSFVYFDTSKLKTVGFGFNMDSLSAEEIWNDSDIPESFNNVYTHKEAISRESAYALFLDIWSSSERSAASRAKDLGFDYDTFPVWKRFILADIVYNTGSISEWKKVFEAERADEVLFEARRKENGVYETMDSRVAKIGYHFGLIETLEDAHRIGLVGAEYLV